MPRRPFPSGGGLTGLGETPETLPQAWDLATPEPRHAEASLARRSPPPESRAPIFEPAAPDSVRGLLAGFASRELTPSEALQRLKARVATDGSGAVLTLIPGAEAAAEASDLRWREGRARPLEGIPFGVKDIFDVVGARVTCGSLLTGDRVATRDAEVVARLRAAGAIPFAMLATTEFACGSPHNPRYGAVANPYDPARWTGGSSTGSGAALSLGLTPLALGTDTGGSIRVPSAWCGVTGLKPTREIVSREGVAPLSWTLDHVGPMARSASDLAVVLPNLGDHISIPGLDGFSGLRVGVPNRWFPDVCDDGVLRAWRAALDLMQSRGARLVEVEVGDVARAHADGWTVLLSELASMQAPAFDRHDLFDLGAQRRILQGRAISALDYLAALRRRPLAIQHWIDALADVDVLLTPGIGGEAGFLDTLDVAVNGARVAFQDLIPRNTMIFDYTGLPALMLPSGVGDAGLPVAVQIVGKPHDDGLCLAVGAAFQAVTSHHLRQAGT